MLQRIKHHIHSLEMTDMSNEILSQLTASGEKFAAPVAKLNKLAVAKVEELAALELASLRAYSELSLSQLKAAVAVSDADSLKTFADSQSAAVQSLSEKLIADAQEVAKIGEAYRNEALEIARDSAAELNVKAV
jgi:phasin family protein